MNGQQMFVNGYPAMGMNMGMGMPMGGYPMGYPMNGFMAQPMMAAQNMLVPQMNNALTEEEIKMLIALRPQGVVNLSIDQNDYYRSMCTHKHQHRDVVQQLADGSGLVYCPICGAKWNPNSLTRDEVEQLVDQLISAMQNVKWTADLPAQLVREYFTMIPLIKKFPDLYEYGAKAFDKFLNQNGWQIAGDSNIYALYNSLFGGYPQAMNFGFNPMAMGMAPQYDPNVMMQQQMGYYQQPVQQMQTPAPQVITPADPNMNPMQQPMAANQVPMNYAVPTVGPNGMIMPTTPVMGAPGMTMGVYNPTQAQPIIGPSGQMYNNPMQQGVVYPGGQPQVQVPGQQIAGGTGVPTQTAQPQGQPAPMVSKNVTL